jgi:prephenate dehydrogenase
MDFYRGRKAIFPSNTESDVRALGALMDDADVGTVGGESSLEKMWTDHPWLLAILESHRRQCSADNSLTKPFAHSGDDLVCDECQTTVANWQRDRKSNQTVGVIGFGNFGRFLAKHLLRAFHNITVSDVIPRDKEAAERGLAWASLEETANKEIVVLAVPLQNLEQLLKQVSACFPRNGLVVDVCSVKQAPIRLMLQHLPPSVEIVGTHPLFGPQSAKAGLAGHRIVICPERVNEQRAAKIHSLLSHGFGLQTLERDAETHDREMATVQALTHFIARGLAECGIHQSELATVSFSKLCEAAELLGSDSWELFKTIELGNSFAAEVRARFMEELKELEMKLSE